MSISIPLAMKSIISDLKESVAEAKAARDQLKEIKDLKALATEAKQAKDPYEAYLKAFGELKPANAKK